MPIDIVSFPGMGIAVATLPALFCSGAPEHPATLSDTARRGRLNSWRVFMRVS
jgi:hypothetical protein